MLAKISEKILSHLNDNGLDVQEIEFKQLVDRQVGSLMRPKVNVSINDGTHKKVTMNTYKQIPIVSLFLMVQNLKGEKEARFAAYKLIDAIVNSLLLEKLDLPLQDPFKPIRFTNVTDDEYSGSNYSLYQIDFTCSFNYTATLPEDKDQGELLKIVNTYYNDDQNFKGEVDLSSVDSGDAFSEEIEIVNGGTAADETITEIINGGDANSKFENEVIS